jgi:hypothetical protein
MTYLSPILVVEGLIQRFSQSDHTISRKENIMKVLLTSALAVVFCTLSMGAVADPDKPRVFQTSPVWNGGSGEAIGAAWLKRSKDRVEGRIMTTVDTEGIPYTVWWVVFNNPDGCSGDCGPDDLDPPGWGGDADVAVFNASGAISASDGMGNAVINLDFSAIGGEGAGNGSQGSPAPPMVKFFGRVLKKNNARCAEIHLDINQHPDLDDPVDWVAELTYPEQPHSFAVFPPAPDCK